MIKAFTLLELLFVISIAFIIFSITSTYFKQDSLNIAAHQILNDLRYTRSLAMMQDMLRAYDLSIVKPGKEYFKVHWNLYFIESSQNTDSMQTYTVYLDKNTDGNANLFKNDPKRREIALSLADPNKLMTSGQSGVITKDNKRASQNHNIEKKYGVKDVLLKGSCESKTSVASTKIIFDNHGRLYSPLTSSKRAGFTLISHDKLPCIVLLKSDEDAICIVIDSLSGHIFLPAFKNNEDQFIFYENQYRKCKSFI